MCILKAIIAPFPHDVVVVIVMESRATGERKLSSEPSLEGHGRERVKSHMVAGGIISPGL